MKGAGEFGGWMGLKGSGFLLFSLFVKEPKRGKEGKRGEDQEAENSGQS